MDLGKVHPDPDAESTESALHTSIPHLGSPLFNLQSNVPHNFHGHCLPDAVVFGSFQQLLSHASSGFLSATYTNDCVLELGSNPTPFNGLGSQPSFVNSEQVSHLDTCDDGYSAGTESETDKAIRRKPLDYNVETNDSISSEMDDYVVSFSDPIGKEEFMSGRDFDYGDFGTGHDDTELNNAYSESDCPPGINYTELGDEPLENNIAVGVDVVCQIKEKPPHDPPRDVVDIVDDTTTSMEGTPAFAASDSSLLNNVSTHEISSHYEDAVRTGFFRRQRASKIAKPDGDPKPRDMGSIEVAMLTADQRKGKEVFEPVLGMVFDSYEEGYDFYNLYSWEVGFGIIYNHSSSRPNDKTYRTMQEFTCQKGGSENRSKNGTRKESCKARMKLLRSADERWYVRDFVKDHNHLLSESCCEKREWKSHKRLDPYTLGVIRNLRQNNVDQTKVRCIVGSMFGSLKDAPCTKRSIRTICNQMSRHQIDDDVSRTVQLFLKMKQDDPDFQWSVELGPDSTIQSLMWCSGKSVQQYACFGDVVTFDTTYCTNFYKMPFGLFVGVNNHFQTIIFAGVLMKYETTESFKWVFTEFLELMRGPAPQTILTDQCKAMTIALAEVWPDTFHLWCKWHVFKNIREHLGPTYTKNLEFRDQFYSIVNEMLTKEEFVQAWEELCERYNLTDNPFMIRAFQCRSKWAKPWAKGNFCAGMTSTQRSECANMMLKKFVPRNSSFYQFVSQYNMLLQDRDMEEGRQEDQTKQLVMKHSRMWPIETHAKNIYTKAIFILFRKQVDKASNWVVNGKGRNFFLISHHKPSEKPTWYKKSYKVFVIDGGARYYCECGLFEHLGILCCHTLRLMIRLDIEQIPDAHILTRWTRNAKVVLQEVMKAPEPKKTSTEPLIIWQTELNYKALEVVTKGNTNRKTIAAVMKHLKAASKEVDEILLASSKLVDNQSSELNGLDTATDVDDIVANRYGASGSSAGLSDTDIQGMKAPPVIRSRGGSRFRRFRSSSEIASKKAPKRMKSNQPAANTDSKTPNASNCKNKDAEGNFTLKRKCLDPTSSVNCSALPVQSSFCSKCKKSGHNRNRCNTQANQTSKKSRKSNTVSCTKCGLKGHNNDECLVVDLQTY